DNARIRRRAEQREGTLGWGHPDPQNGGAVEALAPATPRLPHTARLSSRWPAPSACASMWMSAQRRGSRQGHQVQGSLSTDACAPEIGRANVCTPVTQE